jgi:signal transduction histidine kinase
MDELVREGLAETERAAALIANVKKLSQLYEGKAEIVEVDPADVLREASKDVQARFRDKRLLLRTNLSSGEYSVLANRYLRDVFYSLLDNAMKFDERKKVDVDVEAASISHIPFLKIQIKDRGCGLTDEQKDEIFLRVVDRRQSILGLGLGLTLVKEILESFGGQISVEDRVEGNHTKGANFILLLRSSPTRQKKGGAV